MSLVRYVPDSPTIRPTHADQTVPAGKSSWYSLRFARLCAHNILWTHMRQILQLKPEPDGPGPRTSTSVPRYFLTINMTTVPPTCKVSVTFPEHPEVTEAQVEFYAQVYAVGGTAQQLIHVLDAPLPMLKAAYAPDFTPFQLD